MYEKGFYEEIQDNGKRTTCLLTNVYTEVVDENISVYADHQFLLVIPMGLVKKEDHPEGEDIYVLVDGTTISFYYNE